MKALPRADVVLLGEVHDNSIHHQHQARAVEALQPSALVLEMLSPEQARTANLMAEASTDELAVALDWASSGWPDFQMYAPIFSASDARIYGGALPRDGQLPEIFRARDQRRLGDGK